MIKKNSLKKLKIDSTTNTSLMKKAILQNYRISETEAGNEVTVKFKFKFVILSHIYTHKYDIIKTITKQGIPRKSLRLIYYTTKAVRGPITKINQSDRSIAGPIFSKYWTGRVLSRMIPRCVPFST